MDERLGVFFDEKVQKLVDSFTQCFRVRITILSTTMEDLIVGFPYKLTDFCQAIRYDLHAYDRCDKQNRKACALCEGEYSRRQDPFIYQCHAGCTEAVLPLKVGEKLIGYAMIGQFRITESLPMEFTDERRKTKADISGLKKKFTELAFFDIQSMKNMINLFSMLISFVVMREYVNVRRPALAEQVSRWLENNIADQVSIADAASALNYSPSAIYHTLKQQLGIGFKQLCILKRISRFESLITANPELSIQEAASKVSYDDQLYFSRLYKKIRHITPSEYVRSIRNQHKPQAAHSRAACG